MDYDIWQNCFLIPGFSRIECASWVQACGTVLAILPTGGLFLAQGKREATLRRQREQYENTQQAMFARLALTKAMTGLDDFEKAWREQAAAFQTWDYAATPMVEALYLLKQAIASPM